MKYWLLLPLLLALSCGNPVTESVGIIKGIDGKDGKDGHSLVSQYVESTECDTGGNRLDIYLDSDDSLTVSEGDLFQSSLIACNGAQGESGDQGIRGLVGPNGVDGAVGPQGLQGAVGPIGPQGLTGASGAVGPQGSQGIPGPVGPQGPQGPQGVQGIQGIQGIQGPVGSSSGTCTLVFKANYGGNGKKYTLTCGTISITFTADEV